MNLPLFSTLKVFLRGVLHGVTSCSAAEALLQHRWNFVYVPSSILGLCLYKCLWLPHLLLTYTLTSGFGLEIVLHQKTGFSIMHVVSDQLCGQHEKNKIGGKKSTLANNKSKTHSDL